ncbi:MAG: hypothetical protein MPW14_14440 [Candidatus Manganitrophus sp.]|nr:MAG: hypothetical protein MPW14_14440 [Candidatus Manganitrophus sp.]
MPQPEWPISVTNSPLRDLEVDVLQRGTNALGPLGKVMPIRR